uniref:Uncharacterized protein n=1 Tax=Arundo donax TaxID=35708 RepID=A0A0A9ENN7_ARUDO
MMNSFYTEKWPITNILHNNEFILKCNYWIVVQSLHSN